mmetsp:Transcript_32029/g.71142  ORF Transcript_32029/g.71142 Transcript_32029/m.71142 type:complete len:232 (+) Transcript_32029:96-791(+)
MNALFMAIVMVSSLCNCNSLVHSLRPGNVQRSALFHPTVTPTFLFRPSSLSMADAQAPSADTDASMPMPIQPPVKQLSVLQNLQNLLSGKGWSGNSVVTRASIAAMGLNVLLAYGFVSNASYVTCLILAWVGHGKNSGLSPLAPDQWKPFLLIYAGFFAANNILRPLRLSLSVALSPFFNRMVDKIQQKTKWSRKWSTALLVFMVNIVGTTSYLVGGLFVATKLAGVPLLP